MMETPPPERILAKEQVEIKGENYVLEHKPAGISPSEEECNFVHKEWEIPRGETENLNEQLGSRELESLKNGKNEIIAICSYVIYKDGSPRKILGDGHITLTLVKEDKTKSGIGYVITKRAVDKIIEAARIRSDFEAPVIIQAEAFTEGGLMLMGKIEGEYRKEVKFVVGSDRLLF